MSIETQRTNLQDIIESAETIIRLNQMTIEEAKRKLAKLDTEGSGMGNVQAPMKSN